MNNQLIDYRMAKPELATAFAQGYEGSKLLGEQSRINDLRAQTAEQNLVGGAQDIKIGGLKLSQLEEDRQAMLGLQDQLKAAGKDTNLDSYMDMLINTNRPEMVQQGLLGREKLRQQRLEEQRLNASANQKLAYQSQVSSIFGGGDGATPQVSAPTNALAMPVAAPKNNMQNPPGSVNALNADFANLRANQDATEARLPLTPQSAPVPNVDPRLAQLSQLRILAARGNPNATIAANQLQAQLEFEQKQNPRSTGDMAKYEPDPNNPGQVRPIPGGPADPNVINANAKEKLSVKDQQARESKYPAAVLSVKTYESDTDNLIKDIKSLMNDKGLKGITGSIYGRVGSLDSDSLRAQALYNKIVAKGGFSELQKMRNASVTGGALGNVSDSEGKQLRSAFAALDRTQSTEDIKRVLSELIPTLEGSKERVKDAFDMTYEYRNKESSTNGDKNAPNNASKKTVTRTGTIDRRKVVQYSDGSTEYAN